MRVISGEAKGRRLFGPRSVKIRPALDKVKEAIFNILFDVKSLRILDIFAGTGSIGIEAISRGASVAVFIDDNPAAVETIKKNLTLCGFKKDRTQIIKAKMQTALKRLLKKGDSFDIIFVDPPYLKNLVNPTLKILANSNLLNPGTVIVIEHHPKEPVAAPEGLKLFDERKYGQTLISFLKPQ